MHGLFWGYRYVLFGLFWGCIRVDLLGSSREICMGCYENIYIHGLFRLFPRCFCADSLGSVGEICIGSFEPKYVGSSGCFGEAFVQIRWALFERYAWALLRIYLLALQALSEMLSCGFERLFVPR